MHFPRNPEERSRLRLFQGGDREYTYAEDGTFCWGGERHTTRWGIDVQGSLHKQNMGNLQGHTHDKKESDRGVTGSELFSIYHNVERSKSLETVRKPLVQINFKKDRSNRERMRVSYPSKRSPETSSGKSDQISFGKQVGTSILENREKRRKKKNREMEGCLPVNWPIKLQRYHIPNEKQEWVSFIGKRGKERIVEANSGRRKERAVTASPKSKKKPQQTLFSRFAEKKKKRGFWFLRRFDLREEKGLRQ